MWIGRKVRGVDENVTLRENYVGGRESAALWESSARQLIVSLARRGIARSRLTLG